MAAQSPDRGFYIFLAIAAPVVLYVGYRYVSAQAAQTQQQQDVAAYQYQAAQTQAPATQGPNASAAAPVNAIGTSSPMAFLQGLPALPTLLGTQSAAQGTVSGGQGSPLFGPNGPLSPLTIAGGGVLFGAGPTGSKSS